ncbi:MAG: hypothetical protein GWP91_21835 [Rhodobacterales bacterium]|nr:hypothetical protein [Rhodobacterales bacterium]
MSSEPSGCLLFAIPRVLLGASSFKALPDGLALPRLDVGTVSPKDLPALIKVRNAGRACEALLCKADLGDVATGDAARELAKWIGGIYAIGAKLKSARAYVLLHAPDRVAREQADLELEMVGASAAAIPLLRKQLGALKERAVHAQAVCAQIEALQIRLQMSASEVEALHARLGRALGSEDLVHEVRAWRQAASLALDAFVDTVGELDR